MSNKQKKQASLIASLISEIIIDEIESPNLQMISISEVILNNDGTSAKVYISFPKNVNESLKEINKASSFIRKELARRIDSRIVPELTFIEDNLIDEINKIEKIIEEAK